MNTLSALLESEYGIIVESIAPAPGGFSAKASYRVAGADGLAVDWNCSCFRGIVFFETRGDGVIKRALKFAIGPSVGIVIGNLLFRITNPNLYDETWPPIFMQALLYLVVSYAIVFLVGLLIEWIKSKVKE